MIRRVPTDETTGQNAARHPTQADPKDKEDRPMATTRRATATWSGDLLSGKGTVTAATERVEQGDHGPTIPDPAARRYG